MTRNFRKLHTWIMFIVGLQCFVWVATGVYMVSTDIHFIHGESLTKKEVDKVKFTEISYEFRDLYNDYTNAQDVKLTTLVGQPVYQFRYSHSNLDMKQNELDESSRLKWALVDARSGQTFPMIDRQKAIEIGHYYLAIDSNIRSILFINSEQARPSELASRHLPVWRIEFEGFGTPTLYISQFTGDVVTKRHNYWRIFDWMWRFHIMEYVNGEDVNNKLLLSSSILALIGVFTGVVLTIKTVFVVRRKFYNEKR